MINRIEEWIDQTLADFSKRSQSCEEFALDFEGFFSIDFLSKTYFVVIDEIPKPNFPELYKAGLGAFVDMDVDGITYKNTYFIKPAFENEKSLHFHELIHVLQWRLLGAKEFILRYIGEIQQYGYESAPLEIMAYSLQNYFIAEGKAVYIPNCVQKKLYPDAASPRRRSW